MVAASADCECPSAVLPTAFPSCGPAFAAEIATAAAAATPAVAEPAAIPAPPLTPALVAPPDPAPDCGDFPLPLWSRIFFALLDTGEFGTGTGRFIADFASCSLDIA